MARKKYLNKKDAAAAVYISNLGSPGRFYLMVTNAAPAFSNLNGVEIGSLSAAHTLARAIRSTLVRPKRQDISSADDYNKRYRSY